MIKISPSLLSADFSNLEKELSKIDSADFIHLDVMDGHFVPNITFGPGLIKSLRNKSELIFDTHLMIQNPADYIQEFAEAGSDYITVHIETSRHVHRLIQQIKSHNCRAGIALNPATPLQELDYVLPELDLVLIMSVNPGFGGQSFIPQIKNKISSLSQIKERGNFDFLIAVDGGIRHDNVKEVTEKGAEVIVSGSAIFKSDNPEKALKRMRERVS
ncbi:MAG: ribulose-phosphate 3-epimerase [Halanaerobiales bacterium]